MVESIKYRAKGLYPSVYNGEWLGWKETSIQTTVLIFSLFSGDYIVIYVDVQKSQCGTLKDHGEYFKVIYKYYESSNVLINFCTDNCVSN